MEHEEKKGVFGTIKEIPGKIWSGTKLVVKVIWENKEILGLAIGTAGLVGEALVAGYEMKLDTKRLKAEQKDRVCRFKDPETDNYCYTTRPLTIDERRELEHVVYGDGNSLSDTLIGMGVYDSEIGSDQ